MSSLALKLNKADTALEVNRWEQVVLFLTILNRYCFWVAREANTVVRKRLHSSLLLSRRQSIYLSPLTPMNGNKGYKNQEMIAKTQTSWSRNVFSSSVPKRLYAEQLGECACWAQQTKKGFACDLHEDFLYSDENKQAIWVFSLYENTYLETLENLFNMTVTVFVWIKLRNKRIVYVSSVYMLV